MWFGDSVMSEKTCEMCKTRFHLHEHEQGLVFGDKFFICQDCSENTSKEDLLNWTQTIMRTRKTGMPIALWLLHEENKDKLIFSKTK